jgi:aromatic-amino-acid transaminase
VPTAPPSPSNGRVVTAQALGGTGGLKIGADFLKRLSRRGQGLISDPSWENHRALFEAAGFEVGTTPTTTPPRAASTSTACWPPEGAARRHRRRAARLLPQPDRRRPDADAQWERSHRRVPCKARGLVPFLDMAYQGFGDGIEADDGAVSRCSCRGHELLRVQLVLEELLAVRRARRRAEHRHRQQGRSRRVLSQLKRVIRTNYSNPPTHGAQVVATVLATPELRAMWESELAGMRDRIRAMRTALVDKLQAAASRRVTSRSWCASAACSRYSGLTGPGRSPARRVSVSMRSAPAASAWLR